MAVSEYYSRVTMERLASLLGLPIGQMEEELSAMVSKKQARTCPCSRPCPALERLPLPIFTRAFSTCFRAQLYARIDRPAGIISFAPPKSPNELLNEWSSDIGARSPHPFIRESSVVGLTCTYFTLLLTGSLLNLVESTCHLIHKENMVHKVAETR